MLNYTSIMQHSNLRCRAQQWEETSCTRWSTHVSLASHKGLKTRGPDPIRMWLSDIFKLVNKCVTLSSVGLVKGYIWVRKTDKKERGRTRVMARRSYNYDREIGQSDCFQVTVSYRSKFTYVNINRLHWWSVTHYYSRISGSLPGKRAFWRGK